MEITYRRITEADLPRFVKMRLMQLGEEGEGSTLELEANLFKYYKKHLKDQTFVGWIAVSTENTVIATGGLSVTERPPYSLVPNGKVGLLSSLYTEKTYRRKGIARELLQNLIREAEQQECSTVQVTASKMGSLLYKNAGFEQKNNFMQYVL